MQAVFDGPMPSSQFKKASRNGLLLADGCEPVDGFATNFTGGNLLCVSLYAKNLSDMGECKVIIEGSTSPNLPNLQATMCLFSGNVLRGEKRLNEDLQYPDGGWADCLWR